MNSSRKKNLRINAGNRNSKTFAVVVDGKGRPSIRPKPQKLHKKILTTRALSFLSIVRSLILAAAIVGGCFFLLRLQMKYSRIRNEEAKQKEAMQHLKDLQLLNTTQSNSTEMVEEDIQLENTTEANDDETSSIPALNESDADEPKLTEGSTCSCKQRCMTERGLPHGVCADGEKCICTRTQLTKEMIGSECTCDGWCQERGYQKGGRCGDKYTCICSK